MKRELRDIGRALRELAGKPALWLLVLVTDGALIALLLLAPGTLALSTILLVAAGFPVFGLLCGAIALSGYMSDDGAD